MARQIVLKQIIKHVLTTIIFIMMVSSCTPHSDSFEPQPGDLLFQDNDHGDLSEAIETVTKGIHNADLTHIGIADTLHGKMVVLEAISEGVKHTPLDTFLKRGTDPQGNPKVFVSRLKKEYRHLIPKALQKARQELGKPYDHVYNMDDSSYYCSQLVYAAYTDEEQNPLFKLYPMTFKAPGDTNYFPVWEKYYRELGHPIPQGEPGLNPGSISLSDKLEIVHVYGYPEGWKKE